MAKTEIALFGGTFDPVHLGHTIVASAAAEHIGAHKVIFVPAKRSPLKGATPKATGSERLDMIKLAIADNAGFQASDHELKKTIPSYTLETVREFQQQFGPDTSIYFLVGADTVDELPLWYKILDLIGQCNLSVMFRAGCNAPDFKKFTKLWGPQRVEKMQKNVIETPLVDISSTGIRNRLAQGLNVDEMLAPPVAEYIKKHRLYQTQP
ncbi:MAG: nicotinate (nicotinamide) nucleotide adenylyltransferase [Planctomycetota bacterium]|jgi:nicotinate-nucleotide adenylyltransferase